MQGQFYVLIQSITAKFKKIYFFFYNINTTNVIMDFFSLAERCCKIQSLLISFVALLLIIYSFFFHQKLLTHSSHTVCFTSSPVEKPKHVLFCAVLYFFVLYFTHDPERTEYLSVCLSVNLKIVWLVVFFLIWYVLPV